LFTCQQTVALSFTEAEYITKTQATKKAIWLCCFLCETGFCVMNSVVIKTDNKKAIELFKTSEFHVCIKHINIQYHFVHKAVEWCFINLKYISTADQAVDSLIKPLLTVKFHCFLVQLSQLIE